ncbi:hypothetical protein ABBQ38_013416 [Trebouxia sp. C0009 RCD-2024]
MGVSVKVSGDPRRPNECHKFKQLPPAAEDQIPAALLLFSVGFGMASLFLKIRAFGWAGLLCALVSLANINSADMDAKAYMSSVSDKAISKGPHKANIEQEAFIPTDRLEDFKRGEADRAQTSFYSDRVRHGQHSKKLQANSYLVQSTVHCSYGPEDNSNAVPDSLMTAPAERKAANTRTGQLGAQICLSSFASGMSKDFVKYFRSTWVHKLGEWVRGFRNVPHAQADTTGVCEGWHSSIKGGGLAKKSRLLGRRLDRLLYKLFYEFDLRVRCASSYKQEGYQHNRKKEQLVASAVIASQHSSVTLAACATQPAHVDQLHYPCKHVMKIISMTTGKSGPEIILALGTWAGTELGGLAQLQSDECMAQLKVNFMLDDAEPAEAAQPDSTGTAADTEPAGKVVNDSSEAPAINAEPDANAAMSDDKLDELYQMLKSSSAAQPELRHQLVTHMRQCLRLDIPSSHTHEEARNSLVRLASFVENPLAKRAKPAQTAESQADAVDQPAPSAKPKPKSKKRTFAQQLADKVGNKENTSAASNSQPAQLPLQVAVEAAAKPAPAKRQPRQQRCMGCKACLNRATGKQGCERNKAKRLAEQNGAVQQLDV